MSDILSKDVSGRLGGRSSYTKASVVMRKVRKQRADADEGTGFKLAIHSTK